MSFIAWIVVGAIAGFLASKITGSDRGLLMMVVFGIVGGVAGGYVATNVLRMGSVDGINIESIAISMLGAVVIIFLANLVGRPRGIRRGAA